MPDLTYADMMNALAHAIAKLAAFDSPESIKNYFVQLGIKADADYENDPAQHCPVAVYVRRETKAETGWAGYGRCGVSGIYNEEDVSPAVDLPQVVGDFIRLFDQNEYPELNATKEETINATDSAIRQ